MFARTTAAMLLGLGAITLASPSLAQPKPPGKAPKAAPSANAPAAAPAVVPSAAPPATPPAPPATPPASPAAATANLGASAGTGEEAPKEKSGVAKVEEAPPGERGSNSTNVTETYERTYLFAGLRYRGIVLPKFLLDAFVDGGQTVYSNQIGLELDIRKNGFSIIPAISYAEFGTNDILFKDKNAADFVGNYAVGNSGLKALQLTVDLLWSAKIHKMLDFEYGIGLGIGVVFGNLLNNWVKEGTGNPQYTAGNGKTYVQCGEEGPVGSGCNTKDHQNSQVARVNGYQEPSWANGGSKPNVIPWVAIPQIGLRFKPVKQFESRLGIGLSVTGFWFGLSGNYGFERPVSKGPEVAHVEPPTHFR